MAAGGYFSPFLARLGGNRVDCNRPESSAQKWGAHLRWAALPLGVLVALSDELLQWSLGKAAVGMSQIFMATWLASLLLAPY